MICDFCREREAVIFVEQVNSNGLKRKINICMECAIARGISPDPKNIESSIGDLFSELNNAAQKIAAENTKVCPVCGTSLERIKKTSHVGCPECYAIFKEQIVKIFSLKGINGPYTGSMPVRIATFRSVLNDRIALRNKLNDAIKQENYEKAALYRDYLQALEKHPVAGTEQSLFNETEK